MAKKGEIKIENIKKFIKANKLITDKIVLINMDRIYYLSIISVLMRILIITNLWIKPPAVDTNEIIWRKGLIISHLVFLIIIFLLGIYAYKVRKRTNVNLTMVIAQYIAIISILYISIVIVVIDQLVTNSITPFLIGSVATATIFIIKPIYSILVYFMVYIMYFFMMPITQIDPVVLLSNRINGITSIALGVLLSLLLWRYNVVNIEQEHRIKCQQKNLEEKNKKLEYLANYDSLTNIFNRRCFEKKVSEEISCIDNNVKLCFLILDIDNFKKVNDKYGHPVGDELLIEFTEIIISEIRQGDIVSRIGGEEFAFLLINTDLDMGQIIAERIRKKVQDKVFIINGEKINITVSIGISIIDNRQSSFSEAYRLADEALYMAKTNEKNKVEIIKD